MGAVISHIVSGVGVCHFACILPGQHLCLSYVRVVLRLQRSTPVIFFRRDVAVLLFHSAVELLGAVPYGHQLIVIQRRCTLFCFLHEVLEGSIVVAVLFDDTTGKPGHRCITATFCNHLGCVLRVLCHIGIKLVNGKILRKGHKAIKHLHLGIYGAKVEACSIQRLGIEIREDGIKQPFERSIFLCIGYRIDGEECVELGSCCFPVFDLHMVAAVVNSKLHTGKGICNMVWGLPIFRIVGVVVIALHGQAIAGDEIIVATIVSAVFCTDIVPAYCLFQATDISDIYLMRVQAVSGLPNTICMKKGEHS